MNIISEQVLNEVTGGTGLTRHKDWQAIESYLYHHRDEIAAQVTPEELKRFDEIEIMLQGRTGILELQDWVYNGLTKMYPVVIAAWEQA